jgi:hypothetical protein
MEDHVAKPIDAKALFEAIFAAAEGHAPREAGGPPPDAGFCLEPPAHPTRAGRIGK